MEVKPLTALTMDEKNVIHVRQLNRKSAYGSLCCFMTAYNTDFEYI